MQAKVMSGPTISYDEFEPFCSWKREEGQDTLIVPLPDFKKGQLKVQMTSSGVLKISGERQLDSTKRSKFYKEVKVSKECNTNEIHAKFMKGRLHIVMPKKTTAAPLNNQAAPSQVVQTPKSETNKDQVDKKPSSEEISSEAQLDFSAPRVKSFVKLAVAVAVVVAVVSALATCFMYKDKHMVCKD